MIITSRLFRNHQRQRVIMKRHHEVNPYSSSDGGCHSLPKRLATRNDPSPPSLSNESDSSSSSSSSTNSSRSSVRCSSNLAQLCRCPQLDCVVHRSSCSTPVELSNAHNPIYGTTNLLLFYAHLERCRRHGEHRHSS